MLDQSQAKSRKEPSQIDQIIDRGSELSLKLAQQVDSISPGHRFGFPKHLHMVELADRAEDFAKFEKLSSREAGLLKILLSVHDIGRHQEALNKLNNKSSEKNHGDLGRALLESENVLDGLTEVEKLVILEAVQFHCAKEVPLTGESLRFCYFLRDLDKLEILSGAFMTPSGVFAQLELHYLNEQQREQIRSDSALEINCLDIVSAALSQAGEYQGAILGPIAQIFFNAMHDNPGSQQEALHAIAERRQAALSNCFDNYAAYMLVHVAMIFDIRSQTVKSQLQEGALLDSRITFLSKRLAPQDLALVTDRVNEWIGRTPL